MYSQYTAILIKSIKYGERSSILQTYTKEEGSKSFFLRSAKSKKNGKNVLPPLGVAEIVTIRGKGNLQSVKEIKLLNPLYNLTSDMIRASVAIFLNEVLLKTIREYQKDERLFDFLYNVIFELDQMERYLPEFHLSVLIKLSEYLGFYPDVREAKSPMFFDLYEASFCESRPLHGLFIEPELAVKFLAILNAKDDLVRLTKPERKKLLYHLLDYYKIHIDQFDELKSREVLEEVFS